MKYVFGGICGVLGIMGCFVISQVMAFNAIFYMLPKFIPVSAEMLHPEAVNALNVGLQTICEPLSKNRNTIQWHECDFQGSSVQLQPAKMVQ